MGAGQKGGKVCIKLDTVEKAAKVFLRQKKIQNVLFYDQLEFCKAIKRKISANVQMQQKSSNILFGPLVSPISQENPPKHMFFNTNSTRKRKRTDKQNKTPTQMPKKRKLTML